MSPAPARSRASSAASASARSGAATASGGGRRRRPAMAAARRGCGARPSLLRGVAGVARGGLQREGQARGGGPTVARKPPLTWSGGRPPAAPASVRKARRPAGEAGGAGVREPRLVAGRRTPKTLPATASAGPAIAQRDGGMGAAAGWAQTSSRRRRSPPLAWAPPASLLRRPRRLRCSRPWHQLPDTWALRRRAKCCCRPCGAPPPRPWAWPPCARCWASCGAVWPS